MMIDRPHRFQDLMVRLRSGDQDAAKEVVDEFGPHIYRAIRRRFRTKKLQVLYDSDDCMQSIWGAFFTDANRFEKCETPKHLINYLARAAVNKLIDRERSLRGEHKHIDRDGCFVESERFDPFEPVDSNPSPSHRALAIDQYKHCTKELSSEKRTIVDLFAQGHSSEKIPEMLKIPISPRTVRRFLEDLFRRFRV